LRGVAVFFCGAPRVLLFPALAFLSSSVLFRRDGIWSLPVFGGAVSRLIKRYHDSRDGE
jgi:hypothetical protein